MEEKQSERVFLTSTDLAGDYGVTVQTVFNWVEAGKLPKPTRLGRKHLWRASEVKKARESGDIQLPKIRKNNGKRLLNSVEIARMFGVSSRTINRYQREGKIPKPIKMGNRNMWEYDKVTSAFEAYQSKQQ